MLPSPDALTVATYLLAHVRKRKAQVATACGDAVAEVRGPDFARNGGLHGLHAGQPSAIARGLFAHLHFGAKSPGHPPQARQ